MSNILYEGTLTGTVTNGVADIVISRVSDHSCRCDECKMLDEKDLVLLALCRRYLDSAIAFDEFRDQHVRVTCTRSPAESAIHRHFDKGSSDLDTAIEFCMFDSELEMDESGNCTGHGYLREKEFRMRLGGLVYGYEIRMRTVHFWKTQRPGEESLDGPR